MTVQDMEAKGHSVLPQSMGMCGVVCWAKEELFVIKKKSWEELLIPMEYN